jgi:hypothetical protein
LADRDSIKAFCRTMAQLLLRERFGNLEHTAYIDKQEGCALSPNADGTPRGKNFQKF